MVGSNTANILLVLGVPALLTTMHTSECDSRKNFVFMLGASVLFIALAFAGPFGAASGLLLLVTLALVLGFAFFDARRHRRNSRELAMAATEIDRGPGRRRPRHAVVADHHVPGCWGWSGCRWAPTSLSTARW